MPFQNKNQYFVGICWNQLHPVLPWLNQVKNRREYYLLFQIYKHGIWICRQPRIYVKSQSNLYYVLKLGHTRPCSNQYTNYIFRIHSTYSSSGLWPFHSSIKKNYFPLHQLLTRYDHYNNKHTDFRIYEMSVPEPLSNISSPEDKLQDYLRRVYLLIDKMRSELTKAQERPQTLFNSMVSQHQNL